MAPETKALIEYSTFGLALVGAVLGIYNAWRNWIQDRVRLRVKVTRGLTTDGTDAFLLEVVNLSSFPVTLTHIGFDLLGTSHHAQIPRPIFVRGESLPIRLEQRTAVTVFQPIAVAPANGWQVVRRAYALTACGLKCVSSGRAFHEYRATSALRNLER